MAFVIVRAYVSSVRVDGPQAFLHTITAKLPADWRMTFTTVGPNRVCGLVGHIDSHPNLFVSLLQAIQALGAQPLICSASNAEHNFFYMYTIPFAAQANTPAAAASDMTAVRSAPSSTLATPANSTPATSVASSPNRELNSPVPSESDLLPEMGGLAMNQPTVVRPSLSSSALVRPLPTRDGGRTLEEKSRDYGRGMPSKSL